MGKTGDTLLFFAIRLLCGISAQSKRMAKNRRVSPGFPPKNLGAQTGLRGGKLAAHYARIAHGMPKEWRKALISRPEMAIKRAMTKRGITIPRQPGITARLAAARHPI